MLRRRFLFAKVYEEKPVYTYTYTTTDGQMLDLKNVQNHKYENGVGSFETYSKNCLSFEYLDTLESVIIPKGIVDIRSSIFYNCTNLTSIEIPNSVISIEDEAFKGCGAITSIVVDVDNSVYDSRECCNAIIETATNTLIQGSGNTIIPNSVTTIRNYAFEGCTGLTDIAIPNSVTSIGDYAFGYCTGLTSVTIGNSVTSIGSCAFQYCTGLTNISVDSNNAKYDSRESCNAIIETKTNTLVVGCKNTTIPNSVVNIKTGAFYGCSSLTSIEIPNSVTTIEGAAFQSCTGLTNVVIGNGVTRIGTYAFLGCYELKTVFNLSNLVFIKNSPSYGHVSNYADKVYNAPNGSIEGDFVFGKPNDVNTLVGYLGNATELSLPTDYKGMNYIIGNMAFYGCSSLTSIIILGGVTSIGYSAFSNCNSLTSIEIPNSVTSIGEGAFDSTSWYDNQSDGVVYVGKVFYSYKGTMPANTSIAIEDGTLGIAGGAFRNCSGLTNVTIPNSITNIGDAAFYDCSGLTSIEIPSSVTSIGDYVLNFCTQLNEIISLNPISPKINTKTFYGVIENGILKIPKGSDYSSWMKTSSYYLGYYNWTVEEI